MRVYSIFKSISGEAGPVVQGTPTTFVRLAGCNLRCSWCDTPKTWGSTAEQEMSVAEVVLRVIELDLQHVLFTGGEPLLHGDQLREVIKELGKRGHIISIETNGTLALEALGKVGMVNWVVDYKLPSSGIKKNVPLAAFTESIRKRVKWGDFVMVKFVCQDRNDFDAAQFVLGANAVLEKLYLGGDVLIAFSPAAPLTAAELAKWILDEGMSWAILSMQIHKVIWPEGEVEK